MLHFISSLRESEGDPFIRKYIFPGGVIPSLREIIELLPEYDFYTLDVESLRRHYTKTLLCWRENFLKHKKEETRGGVCADVGVVLSILCSCFSQWSGGLASDFGVQGSEQ